MQAEIERLNRMYREEIRKVLKRLSPERRFSGGELPNLGSFLSDHYNIPDLKGYSEYMRLMSRIEAYDPRLAQELEGYLVREVNLMTLLTLHVTSGRDGASGDKPLGEGYPEEAEGYR